MTNESRNIDGINSKAGKVTFGKLEMELIRFER